jgi:surfactin synthase thioesterase subunit
VLAVAPVRQVEQWRSYTTAGFALRTIPGDHFFVRDERLPRLLGEELDAWPYVSPAAVRPKSSSV